MACCCSSSMSDEAKNDIVVRSDWDTAEGPGSPDLYGAMGASVPNDPAAVRGVLGRQGKEGQAPADDGSNAATQEVLALRGLMKSFVQELVMGKPYSVVLENGGANVCMLSITPNL